MKYLIILLCSISTLGIADTTLTFTNNKDKVSMKMQFANNMMRATSVDNNNSFMIYNANNTTFTAFMPDKKQYYVMGKKELEALGDIGAMMDKMMEKQLANVPEAQREMMRNMMAGAMKAQMPEQAPKPEYNFTGKSTSYNGYDCQIVVKKSDRKTSEFCATEYSNLGMSSDEYAIITSFQQTIAKLAQQYGADNSMDFSSLGQLMPVRYQQSGQTGTLKSVNHDKLDASQFAIPEGYKQIKMPF